jgi:uncharacterized protein (TIGR02145 family)
MKRAFKISFKIKMFILIFFLYPSCKKDNPVTLSPIVFNPDLTYETMNDYDGNIYKTITIGTQTWMAENLKTTKYNDGTDIPLIINDTVWSNIKTPAYSWYDNNSAYYKAIYGALYDPYTVNTGKLCPLGWHVPNNDEWTTLITYLGDTIGMPFWLVTAGDKLKEKDTFHWTVGIVGGAGVYYPSTSIGNNKSGFTALPCGKRVGNGLYGWIGSTASWWSSSIFSDSTYFLPSLVGNNWYWNLENTYSGVKNHFEYVGNTGLSVRCLKNN